MSLEALEAAIRTSFNAALQRLLAYYGVDVRVYRAPASDPYTVYGPEGVEAELVPVSVGKAVFVSPGTMQPYSPLEAGEVAEEVYVYADMLLETGDVLAVLREEAETRRYRIERHEALGQTLVIAFRYVAKPLID